MSNDNTFRSTRYLPQVVVATAFVAVVPVLVVWLLLAEGVVSSPWVCVALAIALSFTASLLGSAYWKRRSGPGEVLFSELLLWGWLHRFQSERRLADAVGMLGLENAEQGLPETEESVERRAQIVRQMAAALDAQDPYTDGHSRRVALHAAMIARKMGLSREEVAKVRTAAAVHDVGKLRIPVEVLNKQGTLTAVEFELVKRHADEGAEIVSFMEDPEISEMVRHHHERFDGSGYPGGLIGEQIPTGARIIAVADTFDALTSERPYRAAIPHKKALEIIHAVSGTQLDPVAVRAFLRCYSGKRAILFWTLLAVSPQRALAFLSGRGTGRTSLGSAATVAMPAALAAVVAAAFGSAGSVARTPTPEQLAQRPLVQSTPAPARHPKAHRRAAAHAASVAKVGSSPAPAKHAAVLGITVTRPRRSGGSSHRPSHARPVVPTRRPGRGRGRGSHPTVKPPPPSTPVTTASPPPVVASAPPTSSPPPVVGGPPSGGPPGGGGGSGNPGPKPHSKQDCMNGGWMNFSFPNQGQCVASVEHSLHSQSSPGQHGAGPNGRAAATRRHAGR